MIRSWARLLAFVASGLLVASAGAATIKVTTIYDNGEDDTQVCSIREALKAVDVGNRLWISSSSRSQMDNYENSLETALLNIQASPSDTTYPKGELLTIAQNMDAAVRAADASESITGKDVETGYNEPTLLSEIEDFTADVQALTTNAGEALVARGLDLVTRTSVVLDAEAADLNTIADGDGCTNGSGFDTISLAADTTYYLYSELLSNAVFLNIVGAGETTKIRPCTDYTNCGGRNPVRPAHRLLHLDNSAVIDVSGISFENGGGAGFTSGGGAILVEGALDLVSVYFRNNTTALVGGAIEVASKGSVDMDDTRFYGNHALQNGGAIAFGGGTLKIEDSIFGSETDGNAADVSGGAIFADNSVDPLSVIVERAAFVGNTAATGSAFYVDGIQSGVSLVNTTLAGNAATSAGTIQHVADAGSLTLNNVTMVDNTAQVGTAGLRVTAVTVIRVANSLIGANISAGTTEDSCDFGLLNTALFASNFRRNYYPGVTDCVGGTDPSTVPFEQLNYLDDLGALGMLDLSLLLGPLQPDGFYVPLYLSGLGDVGVVNRGAGTQEEFRCAENDQRGESRTSSVDSDCDVGAIEYQVGRREDDVVESFVDQRTCLDVIGNDLGDANYIDRSLVFYSIDRLSATVLIASKTPGLYRDSHPTFDPARVVDMATISECSAVTYNEALVLVPPAGFHGEVLVTYGLEWEADADQDASTQGGSVSGRVRVLLDKRSGITTDSISLGGFGGMASFVTLLLLALRSAPRARHAILLPVLLLAGQFSYGLDNVIYVNSGDDEVPISTPGDGKCTLREALNTARNDQANLTGGDCIDGIEGPDIIEFTPTFVGVNRNDPSDDVPPVVQLNASLVAYGGITIRCPADTQCAIRRSAQAITNNVRFRLIDSRGGISIENMTLDGGQTVSNAPTTSVLTGREGGAIFSLGSVSITDSIVRNNVATVGGAIYLGGRSSSLSITRSQFEANVSTAVRNGAGAGLVGGGAIATTSGDNHQVNILASTFTGNQSGSGAAVLNLNSAGPVAIGNSTFSGNISTQGAGAIDVSGVDSNITLRNLTIIDNRSGIDPVREAWDAAPGTQRAAVEAGNESPTLTTNIVADNLDVGGVLDANCGSGVFASYYNLYGSLVDCAFPFNEGDTLVAPGTVFPGLLGPLTDIGIVPWMHLPIDPLTATDIVDAGYKATGTAAENQTGALELGLKCATTDQRGASRGAGGRCDRGAYEYLTATAIDDSGSNYNRPDRLVLVDILKNDLYDNFDDITANDYLKDCDTLDTSVSGHVRWVRQVTTPPVPPVASWPVCVDVTLGTATGTVDFLRKNDLDDLHLILRLDPATQITVAMLPAGYLDGTFPDDYVAGWDPDAPHTSDEIQNLANNYVVTESMLLPGYVLRYDNNDVLTTVDNGGPVKLQYVAYTEDQLTPSSSATISISVDNVPPNARADTFVLAPGEPIVFSPLANDADDDGNPPNLTLKSVSCPEVNDPIDESIVLYYQCEFGKVWLDTVNGTITWKPDNSFNPFKETFTYDMTDNDPVSPKVDTGTVTITIDRPRANGGSILGEDDLSDILGIDFLGAPGHVFMLSLMLSLVRRRRQHR